ncbi:hypothetical protein ACWGRN_29910 [Streptomyces albidoflavus]
MFDRIKLVSGVTFVAVIVVVIASFESLSLAAGWLVCAYVVWRAFPAVLVDVRRFRDRWFPKTSWRF